MLREIVFPSLAKSKTEIAKLLGVSRQTLYDVLNERQPITANLALRIGKLVGDGPEVWLTMQQNYDLAMAERALAKELKSIPTLQAVD
jgi:addiction module HigA family antidote